MGYTRTVNPLRAAVVLIALGSALVLAQEPPSFAASQKANAQALRKYTWKSRTELKLKGESKNVKLEQVRYDMDGKLQKTPLGGPPRPRRRPSRAGAAGAAAGSRRRSSKTRRKSLVT